MELQAQNTPKVNHFDDRFPARQNSQTTATQGVPMRDYDDQVEISPEAQRLSREN